MFILNIYFFVKKIDPTQLELTKPSNRAEPEFYPHKQSIQFNFELFRAELCSTQQKFEPNHG